MTKELQELSKIVEKKAQMEERLNEIEKKIAEMNNMKKDGKVRNKQNIYKFQLVDKMTSLSFERKSIFFSVSICRPSIVQLSVHRI